MRSWIARCLFDLRQLLRVMSRMQAVVLSGEQPLQRQVLKIAANHPRCMPELLGKR